MEAKYGVLAEMLGASPYIRVLEFFLTNDWFDVSKSHVAAATEVSRATVDSIWEDLISENLIVKTRTVGRAELYQLNKQNPATKILQGFQLELASMYADQEEARIKQKITVKKQKAKPR